MRSSIIHAAKPLVPPLHEHHLPMDHIFYGIIAIAIFMALLAVLWSFRNTAERFGQQRPRSGKSEH